MARELQDLVRDALTGAVESVGRASGSARDAARSKGGLSGAKRIAVGAGAAALAPVALHGFGKLAHGLGADGLGEALSSPRDAVADAAAKAGDRLSSGVKGQIEDKVQGAGGIGGILKVAAKAVVPGGGNEGRDDNDGVPGVGKGRRMPVQQSVDIGVPLEAVYNQWTQFEQWPQFMHRVTRVTQDDDCTVLFATKIWGRTKEFTAEIETQRPDERLKWRVSQGLDHTGVVTFHALGPNLTRVMLDFDVKPGGLLEKLARGARHVKRAARADLHRFKAFIEMAERETGAWRGTIEDGEVVSDHDVAYDRQRQYSDLDDLVGEAPGGDEKRGGSRGRSREDGGRGRAGGGDPGHAERRRRQPSSSSRSRSSASSSAAKSSSRSSSRQSNGRGRSSRATSSGGSGGRRSQKNGSR